MKIHYKRVFILLVTALILSFLVYNLPPIKNRLEWRLEELQAQVKYALSPPEQVVFVPKQQGQSPTNTAIISQTQIPTLSPTQTKLPVSVFATATLVPTPTLMPTPPPASIQLSGFRHEYQRWNNCGPATLSIALSFWGWQGDQKDIAPVTKPNPRDKNVMPYELVDFVENRTKLEVISRVGGDVTLLKSLIAAGFPVIVEKGFEGASFDGWMGHYELVTGYDDDSGRFTVQDSYMGPNLKLPYPQVESYWRAFNFTYLVIYPPDHEPDVSAILDRQMDEMDNDRYALQKSSDETNSLSGRDLFFAWFNRGTSLVALQDYAGATQAYDQAFALYTSIPEKERPWRMLWYQTGPYGAYFYSGRYQDVIDLANKTLGNMSEPDLEESYYWRGMAVEALGNVSEATQNYKDSLKYHPGFEPALSALQRLGGN